MINTILQELIQAINGDPLTSAHAAVGTSVTVLLVGLIAILIGNCMYLAYDQHHWLSYVSLTIQTIGGLLYFVGDNLSDLLSHYGNEFNCNDECLANSTIAGAALQGVALVIFQVVPLECHILIGEEKKDEYKLWYTPLDMITLIFKINTLYSTVITMVESPYSCSNGTIAVSTVFLCLCCIMGWIYGVSYSCRVVSKIEETRTQVVTGIIFLCVSLCLPFYLLVDNNLPLDCACRCDANMTVNSNMTVNMTQDTCNQRVSIGRLVSIFIIFCIIALSSAILFSIYEAEDKTRRDNTENGMTRGKCSSCLDLFCGSVCCGIQYIGSCFREQSKIHPGQEPVPISHPYQDQVPELYV